MTLICCPLMVQSVERALADAAIAREMGADLVEYRLDELFSGGQGAGSDLSMEIAAACDLVSRSSVACIATCRPTWEGGLYDGPEDARIALFEALGTLGPPGGHPPRYIDVELEAYERSANLRQKVHLAVNFDPRDGRAAGEGQGGDGSVGDGPEPGRGGGRDLAPGLVLSMHDFSGRPADLTRRLMSGRRHRAARVLKVAYRARSLRDNLELLDILSGRDRPTIALGMGEFGLMSRVLAPKFGGFLTFASIRSGEVTAPGQPTIRELLETFRFRAIGARTRVYGVAGWPVGHSMSPLVHNAGFTAVGHDGVYLPLPIAAADGSGPEAAEASYASFKATVLALVGHEGLDFGGCSVTLPHKENLVRLAREMAGAGEEWSIADEVGLCGAANTLVRGREGERGASWRVMNTDATAARVCLESALGELEGRRIDVLGAGGVGRTIATVCAAAGARVRVLARDWERAARVVEQIRGGLGQAPDPGSGGRARAGGERLTAGLLSDSGGASTDAIVNATPVGMTGGAAPDESLVDAERVARLSPGCVVFDTVYNPAETPLLRGARAAGLGTIDGVRMFVLQGEAQFRAWTGGDPPAGLFDLLVRERLGSATSAR